MTEHIPPDVADLIPPPRDDQRQRDRIEHARHLAADLGRLAGERRMAAHEPLTTNHPSNTNPEEN